MFFGNLEPEHLQFASSIGDGTSKRALYHTGQKQLLKHTYWFFNDPM
jgi:hypothetical protein